VRRFSNSRRGIGQWPPLTTLLENGRLEIYVNLVEKAIRPKFPLLSCGFVRMVLPFRKGRAVNEPCAQKVGLLVLGKGGIWILPVWLAKRDSGQLGNWRAIHKRRTGPRGATAPFTIIRFVGRLVV
jgi:hypothetical protein